MDSLVLTDPLRLSAASGHHRAGHPSSSSSSRLSLLPLSFGVSVSNDGPRRISFVAAAGRMNAVMPSSTPPRDRMHIVGNFMTKKKHLIVVKPTTTVDEALEMLVEYKITGFPVIDDNWKLVGVVSDYDLLAVDSISGTGQTDTGMFPEVDSNWKTFNELQKLLVKINGKIIADVMTPAPLVVHENSDLEDAARLLLKTRYRRLPVVDSAGNLVGIITRGNVVRAALQIKRDSKR